MEISWQVEDGYAGGSRPQHVEVPDDELRDCPDDEARQKLCDDYVQQAFEQKITWCYSNGYPDFSEVQNEEEAPKRKGKHK